MSIDNVRASWDIPFASGTNLWGWLEVLALSHIWTLPENTKDKTHADRTTYNEKTSYKKKACGSYLSSLSSFNDSKSYLENWRWDRILVSDNELSLSKQSSVLKDSLKKKFFWSKWQRHHLKFEWYARTWNCYGFLK